MQSGSEWNGSNLKCKSTPQLNSLTATPLNHAVLPLWMLSKQHFNADVCPLRGRSQQRIALFIVWVSDVCLLSCCLLVCVEWLLCVWMTMVLPAAPLSQIKHFNLHLLAGTWPLFIQTHDFKSLLTGFNSADTIGPVKYTDGVVLCVISHLTSFWPNI